MILPSFLNFTTLEGRASDCSAFLLQNLFKINAEVDFCLTALPKIDIVLKAIEKADALCPNKYSLEEKIEWCDELSADLKRNVIKEYEVIETKSSSKGEITVPDGLDINNIQKLYGGC